MRTARVTSTIIAVTSFVIAACNSPNGGDTRASTATPGGETSSAAAVEQRAPAASAEAEVARATFTRTLTGTAELGYLPPVTKVEGKLVVTTFEVKNLSDLAIAGLKVEEFWYGKGGNLVASTSEQLREPLLPGDTTVLTVRTPRDPRMYQNQYRFRHAYGAVEVKQKATLE